MCVSSFAAFELLKIIIISRWTGAFRSTVLTPNESSGVFQRAARPFVFRAAAAVTARARSIGVAAGGGVTSSKFTSERPARTNTSPSARISRQKSIK